ncbi:PREDICTED: mucin-17-like [Branchiostoma belcheri]|uniref:Mucin-17-like n=1 Tax=Branchiostoma belcheri TaxID=7741 RepID=A0A6P4ZPM0_BRABE|nr:PREDICTED: mucin-17-like [Branchiostoma belcheri]
MIRGYRVESSRGGGRYEARYGSRGGSERGTPPDTRHESRFRFSGEYGQPERSPPAYTDARGGPRIIDIIKQNVQDSMEGKLSRPQSVAGDLPASRYDRDFQRRGERDYSLKRSPDREFKVFKREAYGSYRSLQAGYSGRQDDTDSQASLESWKGVRIGPPKKPRVPSTSSERGFDMKRESYRDRDTSFGGYSRERRPSGDSIQSVTEGMLERRRFERARGPKSPLDEAWDRDRAQGYRDRRYSEDRGYRDRDRGTGTYRDRGYSDSDRRDLGRGLDLSSDRDRPRDREDDRDRDRDRDRDYKRSSRDLARLEEGGEEAARYIEKIQELEDRQAYLEDKIRALGGRPEPLSRAEEELQQEVEEAHTELDAITVLKAKLETEVNNLRKEAEEHRRRVDGERQARYAAEETFRKVQAEYNELRGIIDDINGQIDASRERLRLIKYEHNEEKRHLQSRLGDDAGSDRSGGSYTHYSRDLYSYRRRDTHSREHHDYDSSANKRRLFEMMASVEMEVSELQRVRREIVRQQELVRTLHIDIHTLQFREDELRKVTNEADKRHSREVDLRDNVVTKLQAEIQSATQELLQQKYQNQQLLDDAMLLDAQLKTYRRLWDLSEGRGPPGDPSPAIGDDEETTYQTFLKEMEGKGRRMGTSGRRPLALPAPTPMPTGRTWGALTKMDTTPVPGFAPPAKRDYGTARIGTTTSRISYVTSAAARKTTSRPLTEQDDAPGGKFAKIEVRGQTTRKDTTPTLSANKTIRIGPPKNPGESGFIHQVDRTEQDQVDTSSVVTMKISGQGQSFSGQGIDSQQVGVYGQVTSLTPQVGQQERIMVTVTEGKVTGAKQLKSGQATELSLHETQQILASVPTEAAQQSGNIMVTVTEGKVIETKTVTEKEAETIVSLVTEQADPTAEKVVVSLEGGQVAGKRIGKDKDTALSPEEAAQLWRSVAQPGQQTGDVVVSLSQGQIVGSQQLTPTEAETIKAVVVEEARPTVCPTPVQPTFVSIAQTTAQVAALQEDKIMVTVTDGKVTGAKRLKSGDTKELSPIETQQIMASVPADTSQQSGNIMVTITEGKVIETKQVTTKEAETIVSLVSEEPDPTAEKVVVSIEGGQVVGKRVGKDKATPLSPQEAEQLWRSVAQPGQQTGDVVVSLSQGQIVGSQQLTPTEAETIKSVVSQETKAVQVMQTSQQVQPGASVTSQQLGVVGTVQTTQGFSTGAPIGGMVASGTFATGTVAPGTVAPGTVAPGTVAPGTVTPGVAPGTVAHGTVAPGTVALGTVALGTIAPGTAASGTVTLGTVAPGTVTVTTGIAEPGTVAPGTGAVVSGTVTDSGSVSIGTTASGQIPEYLPPFARHPLPPIGVGDVPAPTASETPLSPSTTVMASIEGGNIVRARKLNFGKFEDFAPQEAEQMLSGLPERQATQSGNIMVMISEGQIVKSQQLSPWVAEQLIATMSGSAPGQVTVPVSGQATYVPAPGSPPVTVPVYGQAKISPAIVDKPITPVSGEAKFFAGQEADVVKGQGTQLQGTASQQIAGSVITQQATVTVSGLTSGFQAAPFQTTPASTVLPHGFQANIPQVSDETLPVAHITSHVMPTIPETLPNTSERIVASFSDGKIVGAQKIVDGRTVQVEPAYAEATLRTASSQAVPQSGTIMMTVADGRVQETKPLTPAEAQYVAATATVEDAGKAIPYTTPGFQQAVGVKSSQIVPSQPYNYQTPTLSLGQQALQPSEKIMMTIDEGKVVGAVQLKHGESTQIPASEAEKMLAVSGQPGQQSGNVMLTVSEGAVLDTQQVTPREAETIMTTLSAQPDPTAETIIVRFVNGQVVGAERSFQEQTSTLSAPEAQTLLSSVPNQPTPQTGNILLIKSEGRIVESQELTSTEADTIMSTVFHKAQQQSVAQQQPNLTSFTQTQPSFTPAAQSVTPKQDRIVVTVADGKVTGAKDLKTGQQKQLSLMEAQQILGSTPDGTEQQTGNIMVTVTDGRIAESKPVTQKEAETIASVVAEQSDPTAEKVVVSVEGGQVVGKRVVKDKATPISPQEAAQLWRSVAQPGQQTGDVVVSLSQGQIVGSQQLTPMEAETIKAVVVEEQKPIVCLPPVQPTSIYKPAGIPTAEVAAPHKDKIMVTVTDGKVTGAKQIKSGETKELSPLETQQIMASVPVEATQKSANVMVTVTEGKVVDTKSVTEKEAETIVSLVTEQPDPTAEKVLVSVEGGQVVGKRVGKDKATPLSPQEAAQLWRSVAQPGQQTGDVVVSLSQGQIVGSQQLTPMEAETIKAVVVEEPRPTVCPTPAQSTYMPTVLPTAKLATPQENKIMVTVTDGKVTGAKQLKSGETKELSPLETQQIMASVPTETAQQSGNIMVTVTEGKVVDTKPVTEKEAETIVSLVTEESDPTAEKVVVSVEGGQVVGKRVGKDKATPLSPQEAAQLWRSVAQPGQQTGDVVVSLSQGQIVGSQQLTPMEAETIKAVVVEEPKPIVCPPSVQPVFTSFVPTPTFISTEPTATINAVVVEEPKPVVCPPSVQPGSLYESTVLPTAKLATPQEDKIMVTVTDGKVTGAKQLKSGQTKELSPLETQQIMASVPAEAAQKSGNIMVTVTAGKVVGTKPVTEKEAETIVSLVTEESDPTAEKVVVSVEGGQVVGKRVGKDKATPLSPQEAAQLWRSVAQPGQQTGDVVVSLSQGQIVGSQQLTPMEAETIKAVVVEEPKPVVCPPSVQPGSLYESTVLPTAKLVTPQEDKIMVTVTDGKVTGAKQLKSGQTKELSPLETQQIMASVPAEAAQKSGNIMVTVTEGKVVGTKPVTEKEAETIVSLVTEESDPTAEKVVVSVEGGQVVGKRVGKDKATPLSPQEAAQLWRSVAQPGQQTGDVVVSLSQGQIVGSQQLTPMEAETIKAVVVEEQKPIVCPPLAQPTFMPGILPTAQLATPQEDKIMVTVTDGKVTGAKQLKSGETKELSPLETQQIMASVPAEAAQKSGNIMVTVTEGKVVDTKPVTEKEAETIVSLVTEQPDPTAEKVLVSVEGDQVVGKRVGKDKATPLSPQEAAQLWRSVAQPGQQTGDVVVSLSQGQIVGSQQLTPMEAETIKAVVVEEPKPIVCPPSLQPVFTSFVPTPATFISTEPTAAINAVVVEEPKPTVCTFPMPTTQVWPRDPNQPNFASSKQGWPRDPNQPTVTPIIPSDVPTVAKEDKIMVTVTDGKVTGAKQIKSGETKELSPLETQQIMASVPAETAHQSGNIMVTVTDGKVVDTKSVTEKEAETIVSLVTKEPDPTAEKVVVSVEGGQVVGKRVGKDKATPLSPQEAAQLWRSVAQPGQQTGDVVVSLSQGQIVGSQQLTPTEAETIKAVVVEEPRPTVCPTPAQPAFASVLPTPSTFDSTEPSATGKPVSSEKIIVNVVDGKVAGAKHLRPGDTKDLSSMEAQQILAYVPVQKPGNVIVTVADGKVVESKRVTEVEAENIMSLVSEEVTPDAEKAIVTLEGGEIVGKRVGKDKTTPLSPQEAEELWRSVARPGQISGDVMVTMSQGKIVKSQQLTPTEAETIKVVVAEEAKPAVTMSSSSPLDRAPGQDIRGSETLMATIVDGKVVGARKLKDGVTTQVSTAEAEDIISSVPGQSSQTGHVLATLAGKEVVEVQQLTPKDAEEINVTGTVPQAIDTTPGEKVLLTVAAGRVAEAQKVGQRKLTPLSPTDGETLLESASSKTKEPGDIAVTIVDGKVVGSRWVSSKVGSTQGDGNVPTGDTAVIRKVVMTPSGERVVQEVVAAKNVPASEMALSGDYGKRVKVEVLEGRAAMKEFLAGSSTDSDQDAYMTPVSSQSDAYVSASSDAYVTPPSETSDAYVTPPGEPMDYSGPADQQDGKSWFAQVTDKVTSAFFGPGQEGDAAQVTEGTMPLESSIERSTSAEDIFVDADQGRPIPTAEMEGDVSEPSRSAGVFKAPRPLQVGQVREEVVIPSALPGREPTETDERQPKQRTVSEVARDVIPPMHVKTGELKTEPQFFRQGEVQEAQIRPEHVGPDEPVKSRRTTSDLAEEIIGPLANSTSPQKGDVFFTEVPEVQQVPKGAQQKMVEEAARQKRTELEYYRHVSQEGEDTEEMTPEILKAAEDDLKKSPRVSFRTGPPEVIGRTDDDDEDRRKPIATITMEKTEKTPIGDVKIAPAAKVAGKEPGKPTWNKVWPEKSDKLPADVTTMETVEVEEYQLAPGVGRAGAVPAFTKKLSTMLAKEGSTFEAAVKVSGDPQPDITWYHHDKPLKPTDKLDIVKDKGYSSLVFMEVLPEHAGLYSCVATNIMGKATSRAPLVITDEMDSELPLPGAVMSDEGELEAEGEDEAPALPPRLQDVDEVPILSGQVQSPQVGDSSSVSSLEPDDITADKKVRDAKSAVVKELKEFQAKSPTFKVGEKAPERVSTSEEEGGTMVTPTVDGEKVSPGKVDITTPVVSVGSKAGVTTPKAGTQAEVTTPTGGVAIEAVRLPHGSAEPAPVKPEKKKSGLKKMFSGKKKKDKEAKKGTTSGKAGVTTPVQKIGVTPVQAETKPAEGEDDVFSPGVTLAADVKPGEGQKTPTPEETILTLKKETKAGAPDVKTRPGDLPVAIGEVVWAEPAKGATPKGSAGRTPSAELRTPSTGGKTPSAEDVASAEKKKTGWSKFKRTFSTKKKKDKKSSSSSSSIDRIPYEKRQAYASGSLPRSTEKYPELSRSTTMPVRPISMVSPGDRPDLSRASLRTSSSTSSASSTKDRKETRPYSYAGRLDFDPRSPGYDQQRPDLPFVEAEVVPAGGTKAVAGVAAVERNGKAEDSDDSDTKVTSSSSVVMSSSTFVTSSTTTTVTVSGEQKAGMVGANLPTSVSAPTGFGAETASGTGPATLTATVSRTSVSTTASRASVALEDSEDSAREATDNFPKYLGGKKKYRKKRGQKQQCKQQ